MKLNLILVIGLLLLSFGGYSQTKNFNPDETITADSARHSIVELLDELALKHPGFYRYTTKTAFTKYIDSTLATISGPQNQLAYYRKLKPIISRINCLHTGIALSEAYAAYLDKDNNLLPLAVYFIGEKAYITHNYATNTNVPIGAEILQLNGKPIAEIQKTLFNNIPSDGYNQTLKYQLLNNRFAHWYRSIYEVTDKFNLLINTPAGQQQLNLTGVKSNAIPMPAVMDLKNKPRLNLQINNGVATLTIKSFGETDIKAGGQNFKKFVANAFTELNKLQVKNLIIDLRNNTGGTDVNAAYLCSHLMDKPYRYWDRIEVTEPFALSIKGSAKLLYGKPVKQDSVYLWRKSKFTREFDFFEPQQPQRDAYTGKVAVLINGGCMSSCADIAAVLQYNKRAIFVGEETGGGYQGNNSGLIPDTKVAFGITVSVPLLKYINAVDQAKNTGHGTFPDTPYTRGLADVLERKDPEMAIAVKTFTGN